MGVTFLKPAAHRPNLKAQFSILWFSRKLICSSIASGLLSRRNMSKKALVLIADMSEEMEAVISIDVLRRAGVTVTVAGITGPGSVKCSRDVVVVPDKSLVDCAKETYDVIVLPGGLGGSKAFGESAQVGELLRNQENAGRMIAAICAAPTALKVHGICKGKKLTSYPSVKDTLTEGGDYQYIEDRVVQDGQLTTSRGPGTAFEFALSLVEQLCGKDKHDTVKSGMLVKD